MFLNSFKSLLIVSTLLYGKCLADDTCVLPPYPEHGTWAMAGEAKASPGQTYTSFVLEYSCDKGYQIDKSHNIVTCIAGKWHFDIPKCVVSCRLNPHHSVEHRCLESGPNGEEVYIDCKDYHPLGAVVHPECKIPYFYSLAPLPPMRCLEGGWDSYAICAPDCGLISPSNTKFILDGRSDREALPWHAAIYRKTTKSNDYQQICGGSLISSTIVLSAAHCFWSEVDKQLPASEFAVAVGKKYRPWDHPNDENAQKAIVSEIKLPIRFLGALTNYQDDIAVVKVNSMFQFTPYVRPVCLDFDYGFERQQLRHGHYGKVTGWSLYKDNYSEKNSSLEVLNMPYVDIEACLTLSPASFREMITSDKICSEYINGTGIRRGDSGAGLAFLNQDKGEGRYYLRGVASTSPRQHGGEPADHTPITFTQISKHEHLIKEYL